MAILFYCPWENANQWFEALASEMPDEDLRRWPEVGHREEIDFAIVWNLPKNVLPSLPNLQAISSMGAGVDGLTEDSNLPSNIPIMRLADPVMASRMAEYVSSTVLYYHLHQHEYQSLQQNNTWKRLPAVDAPNRKVGVLGLGAMGLTAAERLKSLGFNVMGWSRSPKSEPNISSFHGESGLSQILKRSEIIILLLPNTSATRKLLNFERLCLLPRGACLINCGRGELIIDEDLLAALEIGQIAHATLDVFTEEPLPDHHPFWNHKKVRITPHVSSLSDPFSGAQILAEQVRRARLGKALLFQVDPIRGY